MPANCFYWLFLNCRFSMLNCSALELGHCKQVCFSFFGLDHIQESLVSFYFSLYVRASFCIFSVWAIGQCNEGEHWKLVTLASLCSSVRSEISSFLCSLPSSNTEQISFSETDRGTPLMFDLVNKHATGQKKKQRRAHTIRSDHKEDSIIQHQGRRQIQERTKLS